MDDQIDSWLLSLEMDCKELEDKWLIRVAMSCQFPFFIRQNWYIYKYSYLCWQGSATNGVLGLFRHMGHISSSLEDPGVFSLENGRRSFFIEDDLRSGRSKSNISCRFHRKKWDSGYWDVSYGTQILGQTTQNDNVYTTERS